MRQGKKELQQQVLAYAKTKPARDGLKAQKSEKARAAYRQANESDLIIADAAARYFKAHGITNLPARKALQAEIEQLISEKDGLYNTYHEQKQRFKELQTVILVSCFGAIFKENAAIYPYLRTVAESNRDFFVPADRDVLDHASPKTAVKFEKDTIL